MPDLDLPELHRAALDATGRVVAGLHADQLGLPTPCDGWDVRTLLNHVVSGNWWAAELVHGATIADVGDRLDGDLAGADPSGAFAASADAAHAAFSAPGAMDAPCAVSYGPVPGSVYCGHRLIDVLIHGWDLAVATGQASDLDPHLVDACLAVVEPEKEMLAASGAFGTPFTAEPGADRQAVLLALLGRQR